MEEAQLFAARILTDRLRRLPSSMLEAARDFLSKFVSQSIERPPYAEPYVKLPSTEEAAVMGHVALMSEIE